MVLLSAVMLGLAGCGTGATNPIKAVNLNRQAQVYFKYAQYDRAQELLQASLDADFENSPSHYWLGQCYEIEGNATKAVREYELAIRFDPSLDMAQLALINLLHNTGQKDHSIQATKVFLRHKGLPACNLTLTAENFALKGMDHQAVLTHQRAQDVEPKNPIPSIKLADYYFTKGLEELGRDSLKQAIVIDPFFPGLARLAGEHDLRIDIPEPRMLPKPRPIDRELQDLED